MLRGYGLLLLMLLLGGPQAVMAQASGGTLVYLQGIAYNTSGDHTLIAGSSGKVIRVYRFEIYCNGANNITLKDTDGATLRTVRNLAAGAGWINDMLNTTSPWYTTGKGAGFMVNLSANQACDVAAVYTQG